MYIRKDGDKMSIEKIISYAISIAICVLIFTLYNDIKITSKQVTYIKKKIDEIDKKLNETNNES